MAEGPPGTVYLVGAGPWDPGLITLRGAELLGRADVILHDNLANPEIIDRHARPDAARVFVGKRRGKQVVPQAEIHTLLVAEAKAGRTVVRLKGGDPFVFGRGGEECEALAEAGTPFEVVPGVTSAVAAPGHAGIPLTHRDHSSAVAVVTGHATPDASPLDFSKLATGCGTLVFFMGILQLRENLAQLVEHGRPKTTPAAAIRWASRHDQVTLVGTLADLADKVEEAGLRPPAMVVVGEVVGLRERLAWFERRPLFGHSIAVTRASGPAAEALAGPLAEAGARVLRTPTVEIAPPEDREPLLQSARSVARADWIVLTSANGASRFADALHEVGLDARALWNARIACVGPATAARLHERLRLAPDLLPAESRGFRSGRLAEAMAAEGLAGKRVLYPRAAAAGPALREALEAEGAHVDDPVAYETARPDADIEPLADSLDRRSVSAVTFASGSAVRNLVALLGEDRAPRLLAKTAVACIGPSTADAAAELGLDVAVQPARATVPDLVDSLCAHLAKPKDP